jgi:hypothetical protein
MTDSTISDWSAFYQQLISTVTIPAITDNNYDQAADVGRVIVRDLVVNLNQVYDTIRTKGIDTRVVSIYTDVLKINNTSKVLLNDTELLIAARLIEVEAGTTIDLDYRNNPNAKLIVFAQEVAGSLLAKVITSSAHVQVQMFDLSKRSAVGNVLSLQNHAPALTSQQRFDEAGLAFGSAMYMSLTTAFQVATAVFTTYPEVARSILEWISVLTDGSAIAADFYLQSTAALIQLNAASHSINFVPYLDKTVYSEIASSFLGAAQGYETQYQRFSDLKSTANDRLESANLMLQSYQDTTIWYNHLLNQAQTNLDSAQQSLDKAEVALMLQQSNAVQAGIGFEYSSKIWTNEQIFSAVFSMCTALFDFVSSIGLALVGDAAGSLGIEKAVAEAAIVAKKAEKEGEEGEEGELGKLAKNAAEVGKQLQKLNLVMNQLKNFTDSISKSLKSTSIILDTAKTINKQTPSVSQVTVPSLADGQAAWDVFKIQVDALLQPVVDKGVYGASQYMAELDKLVVYGKAYVANQMAVIQASQETAQLLLQAQISTNQETRIKDYIAAQSQDAALDSQMMQLFFERELNIKRWIFIAIQNYTWAYKYWALSNSLVQLSIVKSVLELQEDLAKVDQEYAIALQSFNPPPQQFHGITITIPAANEGVYKDVVANLKTKSSTQFAVDLSQPEFQGMDRVRLTTIRVWLNGVRASQTSPIYLRISNSGVYSDRFQGQTYRFSATSLNRGFKYQGAVRDENAITIDGSVADETVYRYFQPTPFTEWRIDLPQQYNTTIDLSGLSSITIEFAGSVVSDFNVARTDSNNHPL